MSARTHERAPAPRRAQAPGNGVAHLVTVLRHLALLAPLAPLVSAQAAHAQQPTGLPPAQPARDDRFYSTDRRCPLRSPHTGDRCPTALRGERCDYGARPLYQCSCAGAPTRFTCRSLRPPRGPLPPPTLDA